MNGPTDGSTRISQYTRVKPYFLDVILISLEVREGENMAVSATSTVGHWSP